MDSLQPLLIGGNLNEEIVIEDFEDYFRSVLLMEYYAVEFSELPK